MHSTFGESIPGLRIGGQPMRGAVFNEQQVRAAAGITLALATWAFARAWLAGRLVARHAPVWVSATPKRFAWILGLTMATAMPLITDLGIRGTLPLTVCLICLALMWLETALGVCLGCEIHRLLVRRGWMKVNDAFEVCTHGACRAAPGRESAP